MASKAQKDGAAETLERGNVYFFYRPRVEKEDPHGVGELQRLFMVLSPAGKSVYRRAVVGQKKMPEPERAGKRRFWAFVDMVEGDPKAIERGLQGETYQTKTRGERHLPAARPAGEGVYRILRHGDHTHFAYALELPESPGEPQRELNIEEEADYIVTVKNPEQPSPPGLGLPEQRDAEFPQRLMEAFRGRRFADVDPPEFLDYEGAEIVLVASGETASDLGVDLEPEDEDESSAEVLRDLRMKKSKHPVEPLFEGRWA